MIPGIWGVIGCIAIVAAVAALAQPLLNLVVTEYPPEFNPVNTLLDW